MAEYAGGHKRGRYSLWQTLIALVILAVLGLSMASYVGEFFKGSEQRAYEADREILKEAIESWRREKTVQKGVKAWPTLSGTAGVPELPIANTYVDIALLASERYLRDSSVIASADLSKNTTATNSPGGSYGWFIDENGTIASSPSFQGTYP